MLKRMKSRRLLLFLLVVTVSAAAQSDAEISTKIDAIVRAAMQQQHIPAMTVAVARDGSVIYSHAAGIADLENAVPATAETLIRTGSIAKPISAVAAMTLVEAGKLDLDAPIQKYCAPFPAKQWPITTRELLSHTSGIRHYKEGTDEIESTHHYQWMSDGFAIFAADPLLFKPGSAFSYSTYGYTVVGCVIEGASGQRFQDYVAEHVLKPAGMTHTFVDDVLEIVPHRARGYQNLDGQTKNAGLMDSSYKIPGGGYVSTAEDFVHFAEALMHEKLVKTSTLAEMWTPVKITGTGKQPTYGLGFGVLTIDGEKYVAHSGSQQGTSTTFVIIPGKHFAAAAMANIEDVSTFQVVYDILDLFHMPHPNPDKK